jgi:hypothetical protein
MRAIAEKIAKVVRQKGNSPLGNNMCVVGRAVSFTETPTLEVVYALSREATLFIGRLVVSYKKPLFGEPEITVSECEESSVENSEIDKRTFGLEEALPEGPPEYADDPEMIDEHEPWLYREINRKVCFDRASPFACSFEREVHERMAEV